MIVHNEGDEDQDIKELFQNVFKPFWAGVPVVSDNWYCTCLWITFYQVDKFILKSVFQLSVAGELRGIAGGA